MTRIQLSVGDQLWLLETAERIAAAEKAKAAWNPKAKASQDLRLYKIVTAAARLIREIGAIFPPPWTEERARLGAFVVNAGIKHPQYCRFSPSGFEATWARTR
jgi:hypothetical protein